MKKKFGVLLIGLMFLVPIVSHAQPISDPGVNLSTASGVLGLFYSLLSLMRTVFWIVAVAMVLYAAFLYLTGSTSEGNVTKANKTLLYAVIAMAIALIATSIPTIVRSLLV